MTTILSILLIAALLIAILCDIIRIRQYIAMRKEADEKFKRKAAKNIVQMWHDYFYDENYDTGNVEKERYLYDHFSDIFK